MPYLATYSLDPIIKNSGGKISHVGWDKKNRTASIEEAKANVKNHLKDNNRKIEKNKHTHTICKLWILSKQNAEWVHQRTGRRGEPLGIHPSYCINSYAQPHPRPKWSYHVFRWLLGRQTQLTTKNRKSKLKTKQTTQPPKMKRKIDFSSFSWQLLNKERRRCRFHYFWWTLCLLADWDWLTNCPRLYF